MRMGFTQVALWNGISLRSKSCIPGGRGEWQEGLRYWGDVVQKQGNRDRNRKWLLPNSPIFFSRSCTWPLPLSFCYCFKLAQEPLILRRFSSFLGLFMLLSLLSEVTKLRASISENIPCTFVSVSIPSCICLSFSLYLHRHTNRVQNMDSAVP